MNSTRNKLLLILCCLSTLLSLFAAGYSYYTVQGIVVIDVIKTVNEFKLKKDLENKAEKQLINLKNKVDSLSSIVEYAVKNQHTNANSINQEHQFWQQKLYEAYEASNKSINEQVWKRLNPLIDQYGKNNNLRIMIGANGMGTILYNKEGVDKTNELVEFINKQYMTGEK